MKKKVLSIMLSVFMVLSVCPVFANAAEEILVINWYFDEAGNLRSGVGAFYDCNYVNSGTDELDGGTYVVSGKVTVDDSIEVTESTNLVLLDGCELTVTEGIEVEGSHTLAIYAQSTGENKGRLITRGCNDSAGIGSNVGLIPIGNSCGYIDIYGGYIEAYGGYKAAGIGGGSGISGGTVVIYDGEIAAKGGLCGAGIGGGCGANGGKLTVYGGKITATGGSGEDDSRGSAGIGGGEHGNGGEVIIYDGEITAQGECGAAGIGGGCNGDGGTVSIYGGYVNALTRVLYIDGEAVLSDERYLLGAGIGGGCYGNGGDVMLYGGEVVASIKDDGYYDCYLRAIGGGDDSDSNGSVNYAAGMLVYDCRANKYLNDDFTPDNLTNYFTGRDDVVHFRLTRTKGKVSYKEYDPDTWSFTTKTCEDYTIVKKNITSWKDGWYVADTTGTINGTVTVTGDVHLILESGTILTVEGGVRVEEGSSLTIYSQVEDIPQGDRFVISAPANCAGIGGGNGKNSGNITVHGANLVVNGGENAAAIGGGNGGNGGIFTVYSGRVTANAGSGASRAIGAGVGGSHNGEIYLRDGYYAHSYIVSPGIPEREPGQKWVNLITGSNVDFRLNPISKNHTNNPESYKYYDEDMVENDGSCTEYLPIFDDTRSLATGWYVADGELTVDNKLSVYGDVKLILKDGCKFTTDGILVASGGTLTVYGQSNGTGELVAEGDSNGVTVEGTLNIHGGTVTATGVNYECAGINTTNGTLNIFGGTVTATGGTRAAGIGGSYYDAGGNITINGGKVTATGGSLGAGIGGGCEGSCGNITINGGEVTAVCGSSAAAIGCGNEGSGGDVTVTGGTVNADGSTGIGIGSNSSSIRKINLFIYGGYITAKSKSGNDVIIANKVRLSPEKCESFKVLLDNSEAEGSPYTALAEIYNVFAGHGFAHIESNFIHNVSEGYCTVCGAQVFDTYITRSWDAGEKKVVSTETNIPEYIQKITEDTTELPDGLYVVEGEVTVDERINVSGGAGLILKDGCKLTLENGLEISSNGVLTVYGQAGGTGELKVPKLSDNTAAIGVEPGAELNVHGGNIEVYGGKYAAGIGGGNVAVYGGYVKAQGGTYGAAIGGGNGANGGTFTIYGGKVEARGDYSSGIGGGSGGAGGTIIINGGEVDSYGNIGSGYNHGGSNKATEVIINGGKVNVGGDNSVLGGNGSTVEINGGEVKVEQGTVGVGYGGANSEITIRGGTVDSYCYYYTAIGGTDAENVNVNIYGGSIKAQSYKKDAITAASVTVYPGKCERFTVKDSSGNELTGSPVTAETDISGIISENKQIEINHVIVHVYTGDYVDNKDGTHSRACECGSSLGEPENHTFENHTCVCGAKNNHSFTGDYVNNGDGTHSRKCTGCGELSTPEAHTYTNGVCICGRKETAGKYTVRRWDTNNQKVVSSAVDIPTNVKDILADTTELGGGWYIVPEDVEISDRIFVKGTAENPTNIILPDGVTLNAKAGIGVGENSVLNIYGQANDTGKIIAQGSYWDSAIGAGEYSNCGTINVYGGTVTASSNTGAGIGGCYGDNGGNGGTVTVYGGTVTATSTQGAGIGGGGSFGINGSGGSGGSVTVYGGTVTASSGRGAGIGGGYGVNGCSGGCVSVYGGTVTATSTFGAGIGGADNSTDHGDFIIYEMFNGFTISAGNNETGAVEVSAGQYRTERSSYVRITVSHAHIDADKDGWCDICDRFFFGKYVVRSWDEDNKKVVSTEADTPANANEITADTTELSGGWYFVPENVEINERITVKGTADNPTNIILPDGVTLNAKAGIEVAEGYVLNIYGQANDTGKIDAQGNDRDSAIGGYMGNGGTVTVCGGTVTAKATEGAGICGTVTVYGGTVTATSENFGAGIGGSNGGTVTIYGGTVTAEAFDGAGIGGGSLGNGGTLTVNGGTVTATSNTGAGIGGGHWGNGGTVTVNSGTVTASSAEGAGIGGGYKGNGGSFTITGGTVIATSTFGMPIGAGSGGTDDGEIVFKGGTVTTGIHEHTYSDTWSCNETHHWHASTCGHIEVVNGFGAHTFDENGKCTVCGYVDTGIRAKVCTVILTSLTEPDTVLYSGTTDGTNICNIGNVANGTYLMSVSCEGAVTRTYTTEVENGKVTQEVALYAEGDVNGDGEIDVNDYSAAVNAALGSETNVAKDLTETADYQKAVADVDGDGFIDVLDVALLERKIHI